MKAALLTEIPAETLAVWEVPDPVLGPGSVLVSVEACGICGTDLHIMDGESYRPELPFVLGHEPVGRVVAAAPDVDEKLIGLRIVPTLFVGCGRCAPCRAGDERLCENGASITGVLARPGGFAERMTLLASQLVSVPDELAAPAAAAIVDAGTTAHNAVRVAAAAAPAGRHLVIGAGPVGFLVAAVLRARGLVPAIVEPSRPRREAAADSGFAMIPDAAGADGPFASVIDCAGVPAIVPGLLELLLPHGMYLSVGYATIPALDLALVSRRELTVRGIRSGRRSDLKAILRLVAQGRVQLPRVDTWQLDAVNDAIRSLRAGDVAGKAVVAITP
jgi:2-desacetyl-2-hydroxyethyl bacteriochlorophyllide A dehydrogenase